jgi:hypothetical protein
MQLKKAWFYSLLCFIFSLVSCGGGVSGENGDDPFGSGSAIETSSYTLTVSTFDGQCLVPMQSFSVGQNICVQATLMLDGSPAQGEIVAFNGTLGSLSVSSKLTNSQGVAQITLSSDNIEVGAAVLNAIYEEISVTQNYEYLDVATSAQQTAVIKVAMLSNGIGVNRFEAETEVQLQTQILDKSEMPISGVIVTYNAERGSINTDSALTDANGIAQVTLSATDSEIGAGVATAIARVDGIDLASSLNYEVQVAGAINEQIIRLGYFDADGVFIENQLGVSTGNSSGSVEISAGGTFGLSIVLVDENDQRILTQTPVTFSSNCVTDGFATIDTLVNTINGVAHTTFEDQSCAGGDGNTDVIVASVFVNNTTLSLSQVFSIQAESIGSLAFISAEPSSLVLRGTGGQNSSSISTLVFQVNGALGNPLAQREVLFSLNTQTGGLTLTSTSGLTNSQGQVSTRVSAGDVPTSVRVTAEVQAESGTTIITQSDLLSINTGLPDQNSITLSADTLNPEAFNINEQVVNLVVRLADTFNNPVPDGTAVNFTAESGSIDGSCITVSGACSVTWISANPNVPDHRVTILATAIGHETLFDFNGNNIYDDGDGPGFNDSTDSGFGTSLYGKTGFVDISEAWRDDNENRIRDNGEIFLDYDSNGNFTSRDFYFNGPQCTASKCGVTIDASTMHVRRALVLVTSSSAAQIDILDKGASVVASNYRSSVATTAIASDEVQNFTLVFADTARQPIAKDSNVAVSTNAGLLAGQINFTMPSSNANSESRLTFSLTNNVTETTQATISALITSPSGIVSVASMIVTLD